MRARTSMGCGLVAALAACLVAPGAASAADCGLPGTPGSGMGPVLDVQGDLMPDRTGGYLQIPFDVPAGTKGIQVRYSYDNQDDGCTGTQNNTLDMGVYEPRADASSPVWEQSDRRGWSGSAVKNLAIAENGFTDEATYDSSRKAFVDGYTTRAYRPGPIPQGEWAVELGIAYVDPADADGIHFHVQVLASSDAAWGDDPYSPSGPPTESDVAAPGWYTGDLHVHGEQEPGNATMTDTFAAAFGPGGAGLDFITLVDHNNDIAHDDMKAQADLYPDNLVIPGTEVTTYRGHWNNQGSSNFADFRGGPVYAEGSADDQIDDSELVKAQSATRPKKQFKPTNDGGGWTQVNHPAYFRDNPSACRGCAWSYSDDETGLKRLDAVEIANSIGALQGSLPFTVDAIEYYEHVLATGAHVAAVGSSDAHKADADPISPVGQGATVVHADGLGRDAIAAGVRNDHTYVKPFGTDGPDISLDAETPEGSAGMIGDTVAGRSVRLTASVSGVSATGRPGAWSLIVLRDGVAISTVPFTGDGTVDELETDQPGRYSVEVSRDSSGTAYIEDYSSPIWFTRFRLRSERRNTSNGTAVLPAETSDAGKLVLTGKGLKTVKKHSNGEAILKPRLKPKRKLAKRLRKRGSAKVRARVEFTPDGGTAATESVKVKLVRKKRR
ncbi:MAG: CehA/McbA family metallohydrolase [Solirubrobacterales bacterium]